MPRHIIPELCITYLQTLSKRLNRLICLSARLLDLRRQLLSNAVGAAKSWPPGPQSREVMAGEAASLMLFDDTALQPETTAIFLDFDGTLADIAERPEEVYVPLKTRKTLARLQESTRGAVAIITGRPIEAIDRFLAPLRLPVAGVHGIERRTALGRRIDSVTDDEALARLRIRLEAFAGEHDGILVETKHGSLALHYRLRPDLENASIAAVLDAVADLPSLHLLYGKMVIEVKGGKATKADALAAFMQEEPFRGRVPLFAGDDVTDEDAFRKAADLDGISIKIGHGATAARFRSEEAATFREWLAQLADRFEVRSR